MFLRNRRPLWMRLLLVTVAISLFILGYQWGNQHQRNNLEPPRITGVLVRPPVRLPDFELQDPFGQSFTGADLREGWALMSIGDLAQASGQLAVQRLIDVYNRTADQAGLGTELRLLFVMTGEAAGMARDFDRLLPALRILGGDAAQISRIMEPLGSADLENPVVVGPGGRLVALFPSSASAAAMAEDLKALHRHADALLPEIPSP